MAVKNVLQFLKELNILIEVFVCWVCAYIVDIIWFNILVSDINNFEMLLLEKSSLIHTLHLPPSLTAIIELRI